MSKAKWLKNPLNCKAVTNEEIERYFVPQAYNTGDLNEYTEFFI